MTSFSNRRTVVGDRPGTSAPHRSWRRRTKVLSAGAVVVAVGLGLVLYASATIPDASGTIHGCYNNSTGAVRIIDQGRGQTCKVATAISPGETPISWNQAGVQGPQGPAGAVGPPGPQGQNGINGLNGQNGPDGLSAYEVAKDNGFVGSQAQWLASLQGAQGPAGTNGSNGAQGPQGPVGPQGVPGALPTVVSTGLQCLASINGFPCINNTNSGMQPVATLNIPGAGYWDITAQVSLISNGGSCVLTDPISPNPIGEMDFNGSAWIPVPLIAVQSTSGPTTVTLACDGNGKLQTWDDEITAIQGSH
jgi:hypothetical protein